MRRYRAALTAAVLALAAGCHGGGGPGGLPAANQTAPGYASFTVQVPSRDDATATIPLSLVVSVTAVNGTSLAHPTTSTMNLSAQTKGCSALAGGALTCTATVPAPQGKVAFAIATYAGTNGSGAELSTVQTTAAIQSGKTAKCTQKGASV